MPTRRSSKRPRKSVLESAARKSVANAKKSHTEPFQFKRGIVNKILHYGAFKEALDYLTPLLEVKNSASIIIGGGMGVGKTSLVEEAIKKCDVISIWLNPYHFVDDFTALKHVATELNLNARLSLKEILEDLEERCLGTDKKIVIVLPNFEDFCRKRQSLLYCLTHLTQHGDNISLVGLTYSLDCTEHMEKRVRSRINASFYYLKPPYKDVNEYMEFASLLLEGHKFDDDLQERLKSMYHMNQSIRPLKRLLISMFSREKGKVFVDKPAEEVNQDPMSLFEKRFTWLVKPQLDILLMAAYYCYRGDTTDFTLLKLDEFASRYNYTQFDSISGVAIRHAAFLVQCNFLKSHKMIDRQSVLTINFSPAELKAVMERNPVLHNLKTDSFWQKMK